MNEKDGSCREPVHVYIHAEVECLFNKNKRVLPGRISCRHPLCLPESHVCRGTDRGASPPLTLFLQRILRPPWLKQRSSHGLEHLSFKERGEGFLCKVIALQNTNGQEVNLSVWLAGDRNAHPFCDSKIRGRNLQADEDDAICNPTPMIMPCFMKC